MTFEDFERLIQTHWPQLMLGYENRSYYTPNRITKAVGIRLGFFEAGLSRSVKADPLLLDELWDYIQGKYLNESGAPTVKQLNERFRNEKEEVAEVARNGELADKYGEVGSSW